MRNCDFGVCQNIAKEIGTYIDSTRTSCTKAACGKVHRAALTDEMEQRGHEMKWAPAPYVKEETT